MNIKDCIIAVCIFGTLFVADSVSAQNAQDTTKTAPSRLTIGGYGEAVFSRHFYSDNVFRYSHADRLHDCRARNVIEAIMWHGCSREGGQSDASWSVEKFRQLSKADRDAVVKFINAI